MNLLVVALSCCVLAQPPAEEDPFRPRVVPSKSPPVAIETEPTQPDPTTPAPFQPTEPTEPTPADPPGGADPSVPEPGAPGVDPLAPGAEDPTAPRDPVGGLDDTESPPAADLAPVDTVPRQRLRPPELLAEALASPHEGGLEGAALQLTAALARSADRRGQLQIANAYWQLSAAQAAYHWAREERDLLDRYAQPYSDSPLVQSTRSAAAANVRDARLAVARAQQELADLLGTGSGELPLSVDRPHVGSYNTLFEQIFGNRQAPPRIRLIHRTLPIRRQAIDAHGAAILAALDAVEATGEQFQQTGQGLATLLALFEQLHDQRQAFMAAVRQYNGDIAEYLFAVARPGTSEDVLVSRLILTSAQPSPRTNLAPPGGRDPATPGESAAPKTFDSDTPRELPVDRASDAAPRTSNFQAADVEDLLAGGGLYHGLLELRPPARVQKLAGLLHWDRSLPDDLGRQVPLIDCLRGVPSTKRLELLAAYWQSRECAARYQVLNDGLDQLNAMAPVVIALRNEPGMAEAGVRLQAARRAAKAAVLEAHLALIESQLALTQTAGRPLEDPWLLPATPPQSGRYLVADHDADPLRRRAEAVSLRHAELQERAHAVIRVDDLRASLGSRAGEIGASPSQATATVGRLSSLDDLVWAVEREIDETLDFLHNLTQYNLAIARYALATSPAEISSDDLVRKLVIARTARGET